MSIKFQHMGTFICPVCGKPRGGQVNRGLHEACYRITQQQFCEQNQKKEAQRLARGRACAKAYREGRLLPGAGS